MSHFFVSKNIDVRTDAEAPPIRQRILHVIGAFAPSTYYGGPISGIQSVANILSNDGYHVTVLATNANGPNRRLDVETQTEVMVGGLRVRYCRVGRSDAWSWEYLRVLPRYIRRS